ncbi:MAG: VOC family protein [Candidatus Thorarchaeota archaeon]
MITGIDVVYLHVKSPTKMAEWYRGVLGVEMGFQTEDLHWQELGLPSKGTITRFGLDWVGDDLSSVESQHIMISFGVDDIYQLVDMLEKKGIEFYGTPKIHDVGPTLVATTQDPEGNWIQFSQRK